MNLNLKKKTVLVLIVLVELLIGASLLSNFYQQKIVYKTQDLDKAAVIKKENLIFPEESSFKYYYELKPNIVETDNPEWLGYEVKYTYNNDGLNERFDYELEKPDNTFRIITLGDSFTFGHYVNTEGNWTEILEDMFSRSQQQMCDYKKVEVINLGMTGWDIPYLVKRYQDIGAKYNPDLIIWFESGSGFNRINELLRPIIDECAEECEQDQSIQLEEKEKIYYCQVICWKKAQQQIQDKYSREDFIQLTNNFLDVFFSSLKQEEVIFFTFEEADFNILQQWRDRYQKASFLSIIPNIQDLKQVLPDGHPNLQGHKTIAASIYEYLSNNVINQCE